MGEPAAQSLPEPRVRFVEHDGKQILFHDFSALTNTPETLEAFRLSRLIVAAQPPRSLLTLTWVRGSRFDRRVINAIRDLGIHNKPFVRHAAIAGLSGLQLVVYKTTQLLSGRTLKPFDTLEQARNWLVAQA